MKKFKRIHAVDVCLLAQNLARVYAWIGFSWCCAISRRAGHAISLAVASELEGKGASRR